MTGLWTEVCVTWPTIEMLGEGYNIYGRRGLLRRTSPAAQEARFHAWFQAGAVRLTTIGALLEWQRDWKNKEHYTPSWIAQTAGGSLWRWRRIRLHHGPPRPAISTEAQVVRKRLLATDTPRLAV